MVMVTWRHTSLYFCLSFAIFLILMTQDKKHEILWQKSDKNKEFADVNFSLLSEFRDSKYWPLS